MRNGRVGGWDEEEVEGMEEEEEEEEEEEGTMPIPPCTGNSSCPRGKTRR